MTLKLRVRFNDAGEIAPLRRCKILIFLASVGVAMIMLSAPPTAKADESGPDVRSVEVDGQGDTPRTAILNCLSQGIEQVNGVKVAATSVTSRRCKDVIDDLKDSFSASKDTLSDVRTVSGGLIDGFDVLSQGKDPEAGGYKARVRVRVMVFDPNRAIRAGQRMSIAVMPFRAAKSALTLFDKDVVAKEFSSRLTQRLVERLVQSRKFHVRDRDYLDEVAKEQQLIISGQMPLSEQLKLGQLGAADFLLVGNLEDVQAVSEVHDPKIRGVAPWTSFHARVSVGWRVVNVATGKDHWADTFTHNYTDAEFRANMPRGGAQAMVADQATSLLLEDIGVNIATPAIDIVNPPTLLSVSDGDYVLNIGGLNAHVGEEFEVCRLGEVLVNPANGEKLRKKIRLGRLRIYSVEHDMSYAKLLAGDPSRLAKGDECIRVPLLGPPP